MWREDEDKRVGGRSRDISNEPIDNIIIIKELYNSSRFQERVHGTFRLLVACEELQGIKIHSPGPFATVRPGQKEKERKMLYVTPYGPKASKHDTLAP